ncbi:hypothetical protein SNE40_015658 [Patella caerulea]|uniref:Uncharacterized protein n=1 Tax=Patella caerulea TaxID=87958 RepID=A0AAN8JG61_PATCE
MSDTQKEEKRPMSSSNRRSNKPLMEKRRRARINECLVELKALVLQALKKDSTQYSKLEKADILEMTVKHLKLLQRQQMAVAMTSDPFVVSKYRAGFNECAAEVARYLDGVQGANHEVKGRVLNHLANCISQLPPPQAAQLLPSHLQALQMQSANQMSSAGIALNSIGSYNTMWNLVQNGLPSQTHIPTPVYQIPPTAKVEPLRQSDSKSPKLREPLKDVKMETKQELMDIKRIMNEAPSSFRMPERSSPKQATEAISISIKTEREPTFGPPVPKLDNNMNILEAPNLDNDNMWRPW